MKKQIYKSPTSIWKIQFIDNQTIVLELRDGNAKKVEWVFVDLLKNTITDSYISSENAWWKTLIFSSAECIVLHEMKQVKNPKIASVEVVFFKSTKVINEVGSQFEAYNSDGLHLSNARMEREILPINYQKPIEPLVAIKYNQSDPYYLDVSKWLSQFFHGNISLSCEYLEWNGYIVIGFYSENENKKWDANLYVFNNEGDLLIDEVLFHNLEGEINGLFSAIENVIIAINEKNEVLSFSV